MEEKIAVAVTFRHRPEVDGSLIPASRKVDGGMFKGRILPAIGYLVAVGDGMRPFWGFVKYEAPDLNAPPRPTRHANMATCRVLWVKCPQCNADAPWPADRKGDRTYGLCPFCGDSSASRTVVKEDSDLFRRMVGDLADPLVKEAEALLAGEESSFDAPSPFPRLAIGGPEGSMKPDQDVHPALQGKAQSVGRVLRLMENTAVGDLRFGVGPFDFSVVPEIRTSLMDAGSVRSGWTLNRGLVSEYIRLGVPEARHCPTVVETRY